MRECHPMNLCMWLLYLKITTKTKNILNVLNCMSFTYAPPTLNTERKILIELSVISGILNVCVFYIYFCLLSICSYYCCCYFYLNCGRKLFFIGCLYRRVHTVYRQGWIFFVNEIVFHAVAHMICTCVII